MNGFLEVLLGDGGIERTINGIVWGIPAMVLILARACC